MGFANEIVLRLGLEIDPEVQLLVQPLGPQPCRGRELLLPFFALRPTVN
jgi:hypothetical protein